MLGKGNKERLVPIGQRCQEALLRWRDCSRFLFSQNLLIDPTYADPMREWLRQLLPGSLLILDEAHLAAPASGGHPGCAQSR